MIVCVPLPFTSPKFKARSLQRAASNPDKLEEFIAEKVEVNTTNFSLDSFSVDGKFKFKRKITPAKTFGSGTSKGSCQWTESRTPKLASSLSCRSADAVEIEEALRLLDLSVIVPCQ